MNGNIWIFVFVILLRTVYDVEQCAKPQWLKWKKPGWSSGEFNCPFFAKLPK